MTGVLDGIRVLDLTQWAMSPVAGGILADWGATVFKVEHPETGDPMRGLVSTGLVGDGDSDVNFMWEIPNRGKLGLGIDLSKPEGQQIVHELAATCDVFLTSFLTDARRRLRVDVDDIRAVNPNIVYARGTGQGTQGEEAETGGFDGTVYWGRAGMAIASSPPSVPLPLPMPSPGFGDLMSGLVLAAGIGTALLHRERTGEAPIVDVSLLGVAMWQMNPSVTAADLYGAPEPRRFSPDIRREPVGNPVVAIYRTKDERFVQLVFLQSDRHWPELCAALGRDDLLTDPRYATADARAENSVACQEELDREFGARTFAEMRTILDATTGIWSPIQEAAALLDDPQVHANGYLRPIDATGGPLRLVANPIVFDETQPDLERAPQLGEHTDETLLELGYDWDALIRLKEQGVIY
jgi:crotonobetainyl-CoA:carnitine CoA-transferase CaiB-like acyl-CoA transferase